MKYHDVEYSPLKAYLKEMNNEIVLQTDFNLRNEFRKLFKLEKEYILKIKKTEFGLKFFEQFCKDIKINNDKLIVRNYFREKESNFKDLIYKFIDKNNYKSLMSRRFNYKFCTLIHSSVKESNEIGAETLLELNSIMLQMKTIRDGIFNQFAYLALNRAKIFFSKNTSHMIDFSDYIQASNEALLNAIDKFLVGQKPEYFYVLMNGRMLGYLLNIQITMSSTISFGESIKKKIYKARRELRQMGDEASIKKIAEIINLADYDLSMLLNSYKYNYLQKSVDDENQKPHLLESNIISETANMGFLNIETKDAVSKIYDILKDVSIVQKKILIMKGIINIESEEYYENN